jgi:hypothetical protein
MSEECGIFYGTELTLSETWTQVFVPFSTLSHDYQGGVSVGPDQLLTIEFEAPAPDAFDYWIDDVAFY